MPAGVGGVGQRFFRWTAAARLARPSVTVAAARRVAGGFVEARLGLSLRCAVARPHRTFQSGEFLRSFRRINASRRFQIGGVGCQFRLFCWLGGGHDFRRCRHRRRRGGQFGFRRFRRLLFGSRFGLRRWRGRFGQRLRRGRFGFGGRRWFWFGRWRGFGLGRLGGLRFRRRLFGRSRHRCRFRAQVHDKQPLGFFHWFFWQQPQSQQKRGVGYQ